MNNDYIMGGNIIAEKYNREKEKWMDKNIEHMELTIESSFRNESFARVCVAAFMARMNPTVEEIDDVKTAVSEAVTNAIVHGYADRHGIVQIEAYINNNIITVDIMDWGRGIPDVDKAMEPMYSSCADGSERSGMGFCFMEAFMDELTVESEPGKGTWVRMRKNICGGNAAE